MNNVWFFKILWLFVLTKKVFWSYQHDSPPRSNRTNRSIRIHSIVGHCIGEPYCIIQMVVGTLNLRDAGATHVRNRTKVQAAHNPLYAVV